MSDLEETVSIEELEAEITKTRESIATLRNKNDPKKNSIIVALEGQLKKLQADLASIKVVSESVLVEEGKSTKKPSKVERRQAELESRLEAAKQKSGEGKATLDQQEFKSLKDQLDAHGLGIERVPSDGHCLFNAISRQLTHRHSQRLNFKDLRCLAADYLIEHWQQYVDFLDEDVSGKEGKDRVVAYAHRLRDTSMWGGHVEIEVLSAVLRIPIRVFQADGEPLSFGQGNEQPLCIL